jgi:hypothetical protein
MPILLLASKTSDLQKKYPNLSSEIQQLSDADPTPQKKYLLWSVVSLKAKTSGPSLMPSMTFTGITLN